MHVEGDRDYMGNLCTLTQFCSPETVKKINFIILLILKVSGKNENMVV